MYENFYGLNRLPFQLLPDPDFFYRSNKHDKALTCLEYGVYEKAGFIVITGEIGTGKTTLLRFILRSLDKDLPIALLDQTFLPPEDFLRTLCQEFSLPYEAKEKSELIEIFGTFLVDQYQQGRYVMLILDEAQNLPLDTLEEIRMISNLDADSERLLQIILVGQPSLRRKLERKELRQLLQRVEVSYHLDSLDREEIQEYIHFRLATAGAKDPELFDQSAIQAIFDCTGGVPRLINLICHRCLVYGFSDSQKRITRDLLMKVLNDRKSEGLYPEARLEASTQIQAVSDEPPDFKENSETVATQAQFTAALNRFTEVSGASMKAFELAAAKAANRTSTEHLVLLEKQLAEERELRKALEHRLTRAEDDLARLVKPPPETIHEDQDRNSANSEFISIIPRIKDFLRDHRDFFSSKPNRRYIFLVLLIIVIFLFSRLTLWPPNGSKVNKQPPETEPAVSKLEMPKLKAKKEGSNGKRPPLEIPLASVASPTGQSSDVQKILSIDYDSQTDTTRENPEKLLLPVKITPKNLTGWKPVLSKKVKAHKYVSVVSLANVRKGPNMNAPIVRRIARGTEVEVIGKKGDWMQLKSADGQSAWIYSTLLRRQN